MSTIQQFLELPSDMQQEVLDFIDYISNRRGISTNSPSLNQPNWLVKVNRGMGKGEKISDSVINQRLEEKW